MEIDLNTPSQNSNNELTTQAIFGLPNCENENTVDKKMEIEDDKINPNESINNNELILKPNDISNILKLADIKEIENKNNENCPKEEKKEKKRNRGPNKLQKIIDEFFKDKKRTKSPYEINEKKLDENKNLEEKQSFEQNRKRKRKKLLVEKFDEFLNCVSDKINKNYYEIFLFPVINNYKIFYLQKEKEYLNNSSNFQIIKDENLLKRKKSYGLENCLEIPEIVNDYIRYLYNQNIFITDDSKLEMLEIIWIFCLWLNMNHYSSYTVDYILPKEQEINNINI